MELETHGSAISFASVARHVTYCATWHGKGGGGGGCVWFVRGGALIVVILPHRLCLISLQIVVFVLFAVKKVLTKAF